MLAVVEIGGMQFEVEPKNIVRVPLLDAEPQDILNFNNVLIGNDGGSVKIGMPYLSGASVTARVLEHGKDPTVLVFHKKRRKGYRKLNGHRQRYTKIEVTDVKF